MRPQYSLGNTTPRGLREELSTIRGKRRIRTRGGEWREQVDHSRRRLLTAATVGVGAVGVAFAAVPFIASWQPSERAKALGAPVAVDASKLEDGPDAEGRLARPARVRGAPEQGGPRRGSATTTTCWPIRIPTIRCSRPTSRIGSGARAQSRILGGSGGVHPSRLFAAGRIRAEQRVSGRGRRSGPELAGRILLPVPRLEVRHLRPRLQEHAGAEESRPCRPTRSRAMRAS